METGKDVAAATFSLQAIRLRRFPIQIHRPGMATWRAVFLSGRQIPIITRFFETPSRLAGSINCRRGRDPKEMHRCALTHPLSPQQSGAFLSADCYVSTDVVATKRLVKSIQPAQPSIEAAESGSSLESSVILTGSSKTLARVGFKRIQVMLVQQQTSYRNELVPT